MITRITILYLFLLMLPQAATRAADTLTARKKELARMLVSVQRPATDFENPGFYDPKNQEALRTFIAKYAGSEEALHAEVWLEYAQSITQKIAHPIARKNVKLNRAELMKEIAARDAEKKRVRLIRAERLKEIAAKTANPSTVKMALLVRAGELGNAGEWVEYESQVNEILAHIKEYESETDPDFLQFCKLNLTPPKEMEPFYRRELVANDCFQGRLTNALARAEELERKFPEWSRQHLIAGQIEQLREGKSPYVKMVPR